MEGPKILTLMLEARLEVYQLIDTHYKPMPKKADGSIDEYVQRYIRKAGVDISGISDGLSLHNPFEEGNVLSLIQSI